MAQRLNFEALVTTVSENGDKDLEELEGQLEDLGKREADLQGELADVRQRIREIEKERNAAVRKAVKAARELGIQVPEEYQNLRVSRRNRKSSGKYEWSADGVKTIQQTVSSAMWRLSKGSGGSAGSNDQGVLRSGEFWQLVGEQTDKTEGEIEVGEETTVELPNEREVTFRRVEA